MNGSCIVEYDKSKRKWLCVSPNGDLAVFPPGKEGKHAAYLLKINHDLPRVGKHLDHLEKTGFDPKSLRRAFSGALILASHHVVQPSQKLYANDPQVVAEITKGDPEKPTYVIRKGMDKYSLYACNCNDYYNNMGILRTTPERFLDSLESPYIEGVGIVCKHVWAYHFGFMTNNLSKEVRD